MPQRQYTEEYRQAACRLVTNEGYTYRAAAESLGIPEGTLVYWLRRRRTADQPHELEGTSAGGDAAAADPKALQVQIRDLQAKVRRLEMEKEILKKATAFFASQQP
jgi:transposase